MTRRTAHPYLRLYRADAVQLGDFAGHALYHARQDHMPGPFKSERARNHPSTLQRQLAELIEAREQYASRYMQTCAGIAELTVFMQDRERWEENHACRMLMEDAAEISRLRRARPSQTRKAQ